MRQHRLTTVATIEIYKLFLLVVNIAAQIIYSVSTHTRFKSRIRNMQFGFNKKKEKYEDIVEVEEGVEVMEVVDVTEEARCK